MLAKSGERAPGRLILQREYKNEDFDGFDDVLQAFLNEAGLARTPPKTACLAVAGPVYRNRVIFTNRDWTIDGNLLEDGLGISKVRLINDFVANGYGLLTLDESPDSEEVAVLQEAEKVDGGVIACIGAGTGLGECFLTPSGSHYDTYPSEGGHADFAPRTDIEIELLRFLKRKFSEKHRISVERVVSGKGLANVYEFLADKFPNSIDPAAHEEIKRAGDNMGGVIAKNAVPGSLCNQAMDIVISAYGSEAGVAALKWVPLGGLYLTGGLTPKNIERIQGDDGLFMKAFRDKGRVSPLLLQVPVKAVLVEDLGQRGAHFVAFTLYRSIVDCRKREADADRFRKSTAGAQWGIMEPESRTPPKQPVRWARVILRTLLVSGALLGAAVYLKEKKIAKSE
eukprot:scaffold3307_cov265-Pinguiococcus_pyrenoidosus.AAC.20